MEECRLLTKDDIEVRVGQTSTYSYDGQSVVKVSLLLYKNARIDMKILDELYTPMGWRRTHKLIGDNLYCLVEVFNPATKEWIGKEDVGVESNTEAEKGQASDAFKRACVNWGIGRELYTAPKVSIELNEKEYSIDQNKRIKVWASFSVSLIEYDKKNRTISNLEIVDRFGRVRFSMNPFGSTSPEDKSSVPDKNAVETRKAVRAVASPKYKPLDPDTYYKIIKNFSLGKAAKSGNDYRMEWVSMTNAGKEEVKAFNSAVMEYCKNNLLPLPKDF